MTPHKHAEIFRALAEGHKIEWRRWPSEGWNELLSAVTVCDLVDGKDTFEYRIKPEKKWYRVAFFSRQVEGGELAEWAGITATPDGEKEFEARADFSRWITDRIYYE